MRDAILASLLFVALAQGAGADVLDEFLRELHGFQAHFQQTLFDERGRQLEQVSGRLYLGPPDRFHWAYLSPYRQQIISDGNSVWLYDEDLEQVIIRSLEQITSTPATIFSELRSHFQRHSLGRMDGYHWLELRPLADDSEYRLLQLAFDTDTQLPVRLAISDQLGQTVRIDFARARRNPILDDSLFTLRVAPGVERIDERHGGGASR